jgi:hypothetical protein
MPQPATGPASPSTQKPGSTVHLDVYVEGDADARLIVRSGLASGEAGEPKILAEYDLSTGEAARFSRSPDLLPDVPPAAAAPPSPDKVEALPGSKRRRRRLIHATLRDGSIVPAQPVSLPSEGDVHILVETPAPGPASPGAILSRWAWLTWTSMSALARLATLSFWLFVASLGVYLTTRLASLDSFPIYFFTDEAIQTVLAADFLRDGFRDYLGHLLPTYFANGALYNLSLSVYLQVLPTWLFGKSVFVTRAAAVLATTFGMAGVGLLLKDIYRLKDWWVGVLVLAVTPAWFLHSRTAFETTLMVSFYVWFFYFYLLYRTRSPRFLYAALVFGAMAFYSYSPGQLIVVVTGALLGLSDLRYHWQHRKFAAYGLVLLIFLILPYVRFRIEHPSETYFHLRMLDSYWLHAIPLTQKLATFARNYAFGLSPLYWFLPNDHDLARHLLRGYGHIHVLALPFAAAGLGLALMRFRQSAYRAVLVALLAAPAGSALVGIGITRALVMVFPVAVLTSLGLQLLLDWIGRRVPGRVISLVTFSLLTLASLWMTRDALANGPTWYDDYGLGGLQYGARQVFGRVADYLEENPNDRVIVTTSWSNGTDVVRRFFFPDEAPVFLGAPDSFLRRRLDLNERIAHVVTQEELEQLEVDPKIADLQVLDTIEYPDGRAGFFFIKMAYAPDAERLFAEEEAERQKPVVEEAIVEGQPATVAHSLLDGGEVHHMFDGDLFTLARGAEANPLILDISFSNPQVWERLVLTTGSMSMRVNLTLFPVDGSDPVVLEQAFMDLPPDPTVTLDFPADLGTIGKVRLAITQLDAGVPAKIHIREVQFE